MLEAMRRASPEVVPEPVTQGRARSGDRPPDGPASRRPPWREGLRVRRRQGRRRHDDDRVNLATALAKLDPTSTLLIDLHSANGDAAVFLGAEPRFSVVDALENTHRLDEAFFRSLVVRTKSGLDLLASSERAHGHVPWTAGASGALIEFAARSLSRTSCSTCRGPTPSVLDSLESVAKIVVVVNQELPTVRNASRISDGAAAALRGGQGRRW